MMSAMTMHIRVLRTLATQYEALADDLLDGSEMMPIGEIRDHANHHIALLKSMAIAHKRAADQLEESGEG
jgi:hypothetical protein